MISRMLGAPLGGTMRGASLEELGNGQRMYERVLPELNCGDSCWGAIGTHNYGPYLAWGQDATIWWAMQPEWWHTEYTVLPVGATHGTGGPRLGGDLPGIIPRRGPSRLQSRRTSENRL